MKDDGTLGNWVLLVLVVLFFVGGLVWIFSGQQPIIGDWAIGS